MPKLYVIAGHGAGDPGAGGGGKNEADLVRHLAAKMKELGGSDVEVLDTSRNWYKDKGVNAALKAKIGSSPLIELHLDSATASAKGGHVIIKSGYDADKYDNALAAFLKKEFPGRSEIIVKRSDLANANRAATHGINYRLVEVCFITNDSDRKKLLEDTDGVARGILAAFGIEAKEASAVKLGTWIQDKKGWWYKYSDGTWPKSEWLKLKGIWYWFGADGYAAQKCCLKINGKWYAFDDECHMLTSVKVNKNGDLAL